MLRPQGINEEKSATMVSVCVRNIRANLDPVGKAGFRPPLFTLSAAEAVFFLDGKGAEFRAFPGSANFFTKNTLPSLPPRVKRRVIFFTNPSFVRDVGYLRTILNH